MLDLPRTRASVFLLFLALAAPVAAQDFEVTEASLAALGKEVLPLVEKETGVSLEGVSLRLAVPEDLRKVLAGELGLQMRALNLDPDAAKAQAAVAAAVFSRALLAKYATGEKAILLCPGNLDALSRKIAEPLLRSREGLCVVLAHEAVHAADDLRFGFSKTLVSLRDPRALQAFNAVIEGHAQVVARRVSEAGGWKDAFEAFRRGIGKEAPDEGAGEGERFLSRLLASSFASAYWDGEAFMRALLEKGGDKAVERAFAAPPGDPEVILHPEWFLDPASRPKPAFDFEGALDVLEKGIEPGPWIAQRSPYTRPQLEAALSLLPPDEVRRIGNSLVTSRSAVFSPKEPPVSRQIVGLLAEFSAPADALYYMAAAERLARIKDEKMKSGGVTIVESAYEAVSGEGWQGFFAAKTVEAGPNRIRVFDLVATAGSLSFELFFSGQETSGEAMAALADRVLAAACKPPAGDAVKPAGAPAAAPPGANPVPPDGAGAGSPRQTFDSLLRAVREKDIGLYKSCFTGEALEGEAGLQAHEKDPEPFWAKLAETFRGAQTLVLPDPLPADGKVKGAVEAPEAAGGGIGALVFLKEDGRWKICKW